ncbi:MAG: cysteine--tRNA ligase [Acidimicrobiales bacterium]
MLRLFDTARGEVVPLETREEGKVSMYVCGPTVYGPPHVGHGRQTVIYDVLRRYLTWRGYEVRHVSNVTDIDDHIINRAFDEGRDPTEIARRCEEVWWYVMDLLDLERPNDIPHATQYVEQMVALVGEFVARGLAYETSDGVYLDVSQVDGYGLLALQDLDSLRVGARVETNDEKRSPLDFVLWKRAKPGEPTWPAPFGDGRPGWHTECVVMSLDLLGEGFDLHTGGEDLRFPHHENERAQAIAWGKRFARHWMHHAFVEVKGEKMSKSVGNVTNLVDVVEKYDPRAFRLLILRSHYRSPMDVTAETLADAEAAMNRLDAFARRAAALPAAEPDAGALERFNRAMDDDLDSPAAMAVVFDLVRQANSLLDAGDVASAAPLGATVRELTGAVGLVLRAESAAVPPDIQRLATERDAARSARDWARADALRGRIQEAGYVVEDSTSGTLVSPARRRGPGAPASPPRRRPAGTR